MLPALALDVRTGTPAGGAGNLHPAGLAPRRAVAIHQRRFETVVRKSVPSVQLHEGCLTLS